MATATNMVLLGTAPYNEANALKRKLHNHGIEIVLSHNPQTCSGGCTVKFEMWSSPEDAEATQRILHTERAQELTAMGYDHELAGEVFDPARAEAVCPACATRFATTQTECPECGLCFGPVAAASPKGCGTC